MALTSTPELLQGHLSDWQTQLQIWATSGAIVDAATEALLLKTVPASLKDLNSRLAAGDWSDIPKIELLSGSGMGGAIGAWAESTQTIYLNSDWVSGSTKEQVIAVLTEEYGHYLDSTFNKADTQGDEGELFSRILSRDALGSKEITAIRSETDAVTLTLANGSQIRAEAATITGGEGNDNLTGSSSADVILGRGGNDIISGLGGHDFLEGGTGADKIYGGEGDDYITWGIDTRDNTSYTIDSITSPPSTLEIDAGIGNDIAIVHVGIGVNSPINGGGGIDMIAISDSPTNIPDTTQVKGFELWNLNGNSSIFLDYPQSIRFSYEKDYPNLFPTVGGRQTVGGYRLLARNLANRARSQNPDTEGFANNFWGFFYALVKFENANTVGVEGKIQVSLSPNFHNVDASSVTQGNGFIFIANNFGYANNTTPTLGSQLSDEYYGINNQADFFQGNGGNDYFNGGDGLDTAVFSGNASDYSITEVAYNEFQVTDNRAGSPDGSDTIIDINKLRFADGEQDVVIAGLNIVGDGSNENISGGDSSDYIDGAGGNDVLSGLSGNDAVVGGIGNDLIVGGNGRGNDRYTGGTGIDTVRYTSALAGITVDLTGGTATSTAGGDAAGIGTDRLNTVENVIAGRFNDTLIGDSQINDLRGELGNDVITGHAGADRKTGGLGQDIFRYTALSDSHLSPLDRITDLLIGTDKIDAPRAVSALNLKQLGKVSSLKQAGIQQVLGSNNPLGKKVFGAHRAATFTLGAGGGTRTFLAINNATPGFIANTDALIEITEFKGNLNNLGII